MSLFGKAVKAALLFVFLAALFALWLAVPN